MCKYIKKEVFFSCAVEYLVFRYVPRITIFGINFAWDLGSNFPDKTGDLQRLCMVQCTFSNRFLNT